MRYRTGDVSRLMRGAAHSMRRIVKVAGRTDDMLIIRGINVFPTQIEEQVLAIHTLASHCYIEVNREGRLGTLPVHVEARVDAAASAKRALAGARLTDAVNSAFGVAVSANVLEPGGVERSVGKAKRVVDHRP